jgi:diacylglycerol kinase (ATP)
VVRRVNRQRARRPWTFLQAALMAIAEYAVREMRVMVAGQTVHEGRVLLAVAANGTTFGHGMQVAPHASPRDGLLDVLLLRDDGRLAALKALQSVYKGEHLTLPSVVSARGREVRLSAATPLDFELDGEYVHGADLLLTVRPNLLPLLVR